MLTELSVSNFKSWQAIEQMRLAPITGLFGTNSSGKSSILQLLLLLKQTIESSDRAAVFEFGDSRSFTNLGRFRDVVFSHQEPGQIGFSLSWKLDKQLSIKDPESKTIPLFSGKDMEFSNIVQENQAEKLHVNKLTYTFANNKFSMQQKGNGGAKYELKYDAKEFHFVRTPGRAWELPPPIKFYGFPDQVYAYYQNAGFLADLQLSFENVFRQVYYLGPLREYPLRDYRWTGSEPADMGRRGERVVDAILASRPRGKYISPGSHKKRQTLEERIAYWLKYLGLIHDFSVEAIAQESNLYHVRVKKSSLSPKVLVTDVGFGVSQVLPILVLCYYVPEGSTILLEQPEIHLHPSVQSGLADVFIDAMKHRNVQIIFESHSEHLLRRLQRRVAEDKIKNQVLSLYFCETGIEGSKLKKLDVDLLGTIHNWPKDFFGDEYEEIAATADAAAKRQQEAAS